jgi:hypothetical protein
LWHCSGRLQFQHDGPAERGRPAPGIASSSIGSRGAASRRCRLVLYRTIVPSARHPPVCMETGGVDCQRRCVRRGYRVRTVHAAQFASRPRVARSRGGRAWSTRACSCTNDSLAIRGIDGSGRVAARPCDLASRYSDSSLRRCFRGRGSATTHSANRLTGRSCRPDSN